MLRVCSVALTMMAFGAHGQEPQDDASVALRYVIGDQPIWQVLEASYAEGTLREVTIAYKPYRSSEQFCRAYAVSFLAPAHGCSVESECPAAAEASYSAAAHAYLADMSSRTNANCSDLAFPGDYFRLETDRFDLDIKDFVDKLPEYLSEWREGEQKAGRVCDRTDVTIADVESVDVISINGATRVRFVFRHSCISNGRMNFDLRLGRNLAIEGYEASDVIPD